MSDLLIMNPSYLACFLKCSGLSLLMNSLQLTVLVPMNITGLGFIVDNNHETVRGDSEIV